MNGGRFAITRDKSGRRTKRRRDEMSRVRERAPARRVSFW